MRENGSTWSWGTCEEAARGGHLEVLKWLHAKGCPWDPDSYLELAKDMYNEMLKWLRANGCPKILASDETSNDSNFSDDSESE